MGYPKDLDEYSQEQLEHELERRRKAQEANKCDYCGRSPDQPACRFPERHQASR